MTSHQPRVHCIVLTCGLHPDGRVRQLLLETLASLKAMTWPDVRFIVVDNGSIDGSQEAVRKLHPDIVLIENRVNLGFMEGSNVGLRYALDENVEWVILLNNDIEVDPAMLTEMMAVALSRSDAGIVGPKIYYHSEPEKIWYAGGRINYFTGIISHRGIRQVDHGQFDRVEETDYVTGCAMLIRCDVLRTVGLLDPVYSPMYSEDADFSVRAHRAGYALLYAPRAKLWHKVSSFSGGGLTPLKAQLKVEHNFIFFRRYARWYHWLTIPWFISAGTMVFVLKEVMKGNFMVVGATFNGFWGILRKKSRGC